MKPLGLFKSALMLTIDRLLSVKTLSSITLLIVTVSTVAVSILVFSTQAMAAESTKPLKAIAEFIESQHAHDRIIVRFREDLNFSESDIGLLHAQHGAKVLAKYPKLKGLQVIQARKGTTVEALLKSYQNNPNILYAEPDYVVYADLVPDDTRYSEQWALNNTGLSGATADADINAPDAWDATTGDSTIVVGIVDSGIDYTHPDLVDNLWINPGEIAGNGVDDDNNGYVDDIYGANTIDTSGNVLDGGGHGTHVAGIVGATGNNALGIVGVNWNVKIASCKFLSDAGGGLTSNAIMCLDYFLALKNAGVNIVVTNNSWGGGSFNTALRDVIAAHNAQDILFVASAGNSATDTDASVHYPSGYNFPNVISVAATDQNDNLNSQSNYGPTTVDVGAPGKNILSTMPVGSCRTCTPSKQYDSAGYGFSSGTSMATPHVAGLAALLKAQNFSRTSFQLKNLIMTGGNSVPDLNGTTVSGKRIRAADINGAGSLTCNNQLLEKRMSPTANTVTVALGGALTLQYESIDCDDPSANTITVTAQPGGTNISLLDNGIAPDATAGDGIFTANYSPATSGSITFPSNDVVSIDVLLNYQTPSVVPFTPRTLSSPANHRWTSDNTEIINISTGFPILFGGSVNGFTTFRLGSEGYIGFHGTNSPFGNVTLPRASIDTLVAPFWDDFNAINNPLSTGLVEVLGTSPNRELVIEWNQVAHQNTTTNTATFQIVFFENSSDILFNYIDVQLGDPSIDAGANATVGVQVGPALSQQFSFDSTSLTDGMSLLWQISGQDPVAQAGADQVVNFGGAVQLDGSASSDAQTSINTYLWEQLNGTAITLTNANQMIASFVAPSTAGSADFRLTVTDTDGNSDTDTKTISFNTPPQADAGSNQIVNYNESVVLDGSFSNDSDGTITIFSWTQTAGTSMTLNNNTAANPDFIAPANAETLSFTLTVTDNNGATSSPSLVDVQINDPPTADAGLDQTVSFSATVTLNGNGFDSDGAITAYSWTQAGGTAVTLSDSTVAAPTFTAPSLSDTLSFDLVVIDNDNGSSTASRINIRVNDAPTANAGSTQAVNFANVVALDGSASTDADGSIANFSWNQILGTSVVLTNPGTATPSFTAPIVASTLRFELIVTDNDGNNSAPSVVDIIINDPPIADAGPDQVVNYGTTTNLDGSMSFDSDGIINGYNWTQISGSTIALVNANTAAPSFTTPSIAGSMVFELEVVDNNSALSATSSVTITVNDPPSANAGVDQVVGYGQAVTLNANATDSDGTISSYAWTQIAGTAVVLNNASTNSPSFTASSISETLTFELLVTDNNGAMSTASSVNIATDGRPIADAGILQTVNFADTVNLNGSGSDDGSIASFNWTQTAGTPVSLTNANTATPSFVAPSAPDILTFSLTVTDNQGFNSNPSLVDIIINDPPSANAGANQTVTVDATVSLNGSGTDSDGSVASYSWTQTSGTSVTLSGSNATTASFTANTAGTFGFQFTVTDNDGATTSSVVTITVNSANTSSSNTNSGNSGGGKSSGGGGSVNLFSLCALGLVLVAMRRRKNRLHSKDLLHCL